MTQLIFYVNRRSLFISDFAHFSDCKNELLENNLEHESLVPLLEKIVGTGPTEVNNSGEFLANTSLKNCNNMTGFGPYFN